MIGQFDRFVGSEPYGLRVDTLVRLRWLAVAGQTLALAIVYWGFGFYLPIVPAAAIVVLTAGINIALRARFPGVQRLGDLPAGLLLAYDIIQLALLLYLTGGLTNPFSVLFLAPVLISATVLSPRTTLFLGALVFAAATVLLFFQLPLPWYPGETFDTPRLYDTAIWVSILVSVAFIGSYAWAIAKETRQLSQALAETELVLAREQHLWALDGLAAAAAHELGTPLATIAVVIRELERSLPADFAHIDDIRLLHEQSERCRSILRTLTSLGSGDAPFDRMPLSHLLEEVVMPHRAFGIPITIELPQDRADAPVISRNPAILYGLGNLVENAVDFAGAAVSVAAHWSDEEMEIVVTDDGPGFAPEVINRIGSPYVTMRGRRRGRDKGAPGGLGLGFFIAKTLLERTDATLSMENRTFPNTGAIVRVRWSRAALGLNLNAGRPPAPTGVIEPQSAATLARNKVEN